MQFYAYFRQHRDMIMNDGFISSWYTVDIDENKVLFQNIKIRSFTYADFEQQYVICTNNEKEVT